jgi:predicted transcriptional regulator
MNISYGGIYKFIKSYTEEYGWRPSQQEIAKYFGVTQPDVSYHLHRMAGLGLCEIDNRHRVSIIAMNNSDNFSAEIAGEGFKKV